MTDRELMQQALDALEWCYDVTEWPANGESAQDKAIEALRARLAQPEPEPVAWITTWNEPNDAGVELHWEKKDKGASSKHTPLYYNNEGRSKK